MKKLFFIISIVIIEVIYVYNIIIPTKYESFNNPQRENHIFEKWSKFQLKNKSTENYNLKTSSQNFKSLAVLSTNFSGTFASYNIDDQSKRESKKTFCVVRIDSIIKNKKQSKELENDM